MIIKRVVIKNLNSYKNYDIKFNKYLTFITGINGSGKTSILNMIMNLINPSLRGLAETNYSFAEIHINYNDQNIVIKSEKTDNTISLKVNDKLEYSFQTFEGNSSVFERRSQSNYDDYYRELINKASNQEFFEFIKSIPTPSYLSLDRKTNMFNSSRLLIGASNSSIIQNSKALAERAYRDTIISRNRLSKEFQADILNTLFSVTDSDMEIKYPTKKDLTELNTIKTYLKKLPDFISIDINILEQTTIPFIQELEKLGKSLPIGKKISDVLSEEDSETKIENINNIIKWSRNKFQIKNIKEVAEKAEKFEGSIKNISENIIKYIDILNEFFKESGKEFSFNDRGSINVKTFFDSEPKPLKYLSSGELQILFIITNICLDKSAKRSNIFIIDEPEISLHVDWQEIFVDSLMKSNENMQYILATHSPSIILDKIQNCVDVS